MNDKPAMILLFRLEPGPAMTLTEAAACPGAGNRIGQVFDAWVDPDEASDFGPRRASRLRTAAGQIRWPVYRGSVGEPGFAVRAEDQPAWAEIVRRAEHGESVAVIAHGDHVADVVPSDELNRLRETIEVLSDTELVRDLQEGLADARAGRVFSAREVAHDLAARRVADE